jgi:hypothetical protein
MKKYIFSTFIIGTLFLVSCSDDEYTPFGPERTDYSQAQKGGEITVIDEMEVKEAFETTAFTLAKKEVLDALGTHTIPADIVLYGVDRKGHNLYGPVCYNSASGFYFGSDGYVCSPADEDACVFVDFTPSSLRLAVGQVPGALQDGDVITLHMGIATAEVYCPVEASLTVVGKGEWAVYFKHSDGLTYSIYETVKTDYTALSVYIDEDAVCGALGVQNFAALIRGMNSSKPTVIFYGLNADGSEYLIGEGMNRQAGYTANNKGHWFDINGNVCNWRAEGWFCYSEWDGASNPVFFNIGQAVTGVEAGMKTTIRQKFVKGTDEAVLTFKVHIVGKVTPDLGPDED